MTTSTDDARLGRLEGRIEEMSAAINALREDIRSIREDIRSLREDIRAINARIDRLFLALLGVSGILIAAIFGSRFVGN